MNPGAEYDGEMMAIVRIYTRQNFAQGISGDITGRYENSLDYLENIDPSVTANLRYRIKNVELKAGLTSGTLQLQIFLRPTSKAIHQRLGRV